MESKDGKSGGGSGPYFQTSEFEGSQVDRILHLLVLKSRCLRLDEASRFELNYRDPAMNFFGAIALAVDNLLLAQMNDEVAAYLDERGPTRALIERVMDAAWMKNIYLPELAIADFPDLFYNRRGFIIGSCFLDFVIGTYSAFEMFMGRIYEQLRPKYPRSGKKEKRVAALIEKYNKADPDAKEQALQCIIKAGGDHVSGAEKIEFVMSKLSDSYPRDRAEDVRNIQFYAKAWNSIHNLGRSSSDKDFRVPGAEADMTLLSDNPLFSHDYSDITRHCGKLVEIYLEVFGQNVDLGVETFMLVE